jgi:hypothetical protein
MACMWTRFAAICAVLASSGSAWALDAEIAARDIAVQLRSQGYACENPRDAMRDASASKPDQSVWTIQCDGRKYRVRLVPDMAAQVERID